MYNPTFIGDIDLNDDTLAHYGVKGMKWGRRRHHVKVLGKGRVKASYKGEKFTVKDAAAINDNIPRYNLEFKKNAKIHNLGEDKYRAEYEARAGKDPTYDGTRNYYNPRFISGTSLSGEKSAKTIAKEEGTRQIEEELKKGTYRRRK